MSYYLSTYCIINEFILVKDDIRNRKLPAGDADIKRTQFVFWKYLDSHQYYCNIR